MEKKALDGKRVAVLAAEGFEESELLKPVKALKRAGAEVDIVSLKRGFIRSWNKKDWGKEIEVNASTEDGDPSDYDALVLPGGVINSDNLRIDKKAIAFVKSFVSLQKPIAAICHGLWSLIDAGGVKGRTLTSWPSLRTDLVNAGAQWVDQPVMVDKGLVTSRNPNDLPFFTEKMIEEFAGKQVGEEARATSEGMPESPKNL